MSLPDRLRWMMTAVDPGDIIRGLDLARQKQKRLTCVSGDLADALPGIDLHVAQDSHTFGSMWVTVRNDAASRTADNWVLAGDLVYVFDNIEGSGANVERRHPVRAGRPRRRQPGESRHGDRGDDEGGRLRGPPRHPIHEERLSQRFPSRLMENGLLVTEICLADGETSKVAS